MNIPGGTLSLLASFVPGHHRGGGRQSGKAWMFRKPDKHFPRFVQRLCPRSLGNKNMGFGVRGLGLLLFKSRLCPSGRLFDRTISGFPHPRNGNYVAHLAELLGINFKIAQYNEDGPSTSWVQKMSRYCPRGINEYSFI